METKKTKNEEIDPVTGLGIDYSGLFQEVGIDYEAVEKNTVYTYSSNKTPLHVTFNDDGTVTYSH
jgi:hypothetical protein